MKSFVMTIFFILLPFISRGDFKPLDPELSTYPYPFLVQFYIVQVKELQYRMAYMDISPKDPVKETVVLLHGKNFSGKYWEKTAKDLLKVGYRVIIPDQIGFGKSSKPEAFPFSLHFLAQLTDELVTSLGVKKYILIGHSMGGMLATRVALSYPEHVKKLILINPIGLEDTKILIPYKNVNELYKQELLVTEDKIRNYQKMTYFDGKWKPEYEKNIEILVGWTKHKEYSQVAWNSALTTEMIFTQPVVYEFKNLKMPTLLLLGTRDRTAIGKGWAPEKIKKLLGRYDLLGKKVIEEIPKGKLVEMKGIGHMPQIENYELYWENLQNFLKK